MPRHGKDQHETPAATQVTGHAATAPTRPALRDELKSMADRDQQARNAWQADGDVIDSKAFAKMQKVDAANLTRLRAVLSAHFPTAAEVGEEGVQSAWLMLQHADADPALQQKMLKRLNPSHLPGGIDHKAYSLLVDRVRINLKKPQVYGSQFHRVDKTWVP
ncbi:hypothetical protein XalbCFBP2523_05445 [Xanthomonas albilineans]|nr:hypothetical protein XalbCFBP2523_05445 [Xanthomonas albilineans]